MLIYCPRKDGVGIDIGKILIKKDLFILTVVVLILLPLRGWTAEAAVPTLVLPARGCSELPAAAGKRPRQESGGGYSSGCDSGALHRGTDFFLLRANIPGFRKRIVLV